jgi:hypothetical protein
MHTLQDQSNLQVVKYAIINYFIFTNTREVGIITPIFQMKKLRLRVVQ